MPQITLVAGTNIQAAIDANPAGTVFELGAGTWHSQQAIPKDGDQFIGDPTGTTILNGDGATPYFYLGGATQALNVKMENIKFTNYDINAPSETNTAVLTINGWTLDNCDVSGNGATGVTIIDSGTITGGYYDSNGHAGIEGNGVADGIIQGVEIAHNNTKGDNQDSDAGGLKITASAGLQVLDNDIYANQGNGICADVGCSDWFINGNTITNNAYNGIVYETSDGGIIRNNVINNNGRGPSPGPGAAIFISSSSSCQISGNSIQVGVGGNGIVLQADYRSDSHGLENDSVSNNTLAFTSSNGLTGMRNYASADTTGTSASYNTYDAAADDTHWMWGNNGLGETFTAYQAASGEDIVGSGVVGEGSTTSDILTLRMSEDAYQGDAEFLVRVDGAQVGGILKASVLNSTDESNVFNLTGNWGQGAHDIQIQFLNDDYAGTLSTDRNLYVNSIAFDGSTYEGTSAALLWDGKYNFAVGGNVSSETAPADTLTLHLSEDAWVGNAQFALFIDGKQVSTTQDVTTLHSTGQWQDFTFAGNLGEGTHIIGIAFGNDAYGGTASTDRNLYIGGIEVNGQHYGGGTNALLSNGVSSFSVLTAH